MGARNSSRPLWPFLLKTLKEEMRYEKISRFFVTVMLLLGVNGMASALEALDPSELEKRNVWWISREKQEVFYAYR